MNNIQTLMMAQQAERNPGHKIGAFLLDHSNSPEYLVAQLEAYLDAARADLESQNAMFRSLFRKQTVEV